MSNLIVKTASAYEYPLLIKQMFLAPIADNPDQEILYKDTLRMNYRTWRERVHRLASALAGLGVKPGNTVAVMDWDSHRYLEAYFAIPMMGAVLHTINVRLSPEQLVYTIEHAEDDVIVCHADFLPLLEAIKGRISEGRTFIVVGDGAQVPTGAQGGTGSSLQFAGEYEELLARAAPVYEFPDFDENTRATTFYTTGTTGLPKGVYFSHRQLVLHTMTLAGTVCSSKTQGRFHREDVYMPLTPMFHVHAWGIPYLATMLGVKQVYPGKYIPAMLLKLLVTEKVTFSHCVPTILNMLLKEPAAAQFDLSRWTCIIGGAALPKAVAVEALKRGIDVFVGYGMSETCPVVALCRLSDAELALPLEDQAALRVRTGTPSMLTQIRVLDADGREVPRDDKSGGEIVLRSPSLTQGYLKDTVNSERLWAGGWLHTNDVACVDARGSLRITDRTKDVIKVGGEWLSSLEIEDIIASHQGVAEVAVIGKSDLNWGEIPYALVVPKAGAVIQEREVQTLVKGSVDSGVLPREAITLQVKLVEAIDKTSVGKTNKVALRQKHLAG